MLPIEGLEQSDDSQDDIRDVHDALADDDDASLAHEGGDDLKQGVVGEKF